MNCRLEGRARRGRPIAAWAHRCMTVVGLSHRTVRFRLTLIYGGLFVISGAAVLAITYLLVDHATADYFAFGAQGVGVHVGPAPDSGGQTQFLTDSGPEALTPTQVEAQARRIDLLAASQHRQMLHQLLFGSGVALGAMTVVSIALGWFIAGRVLRPLRTMTAATQRISEANLGERLALVGPDDELKRLANTIDALLARLESAFDAQRRFVAHASHELRTPLTMIRTALEVAVAKRGSTGTGAGALADRVTPGLDRAERLVESFLTLARAQYGDVDEAAAVDLHSVVQAAVADHHDAITEKHLVVELNMDAAWVLGDEALLRHLVDNLIDNAIRYNDHGGWIEIAASTDHEAGIVMIHVANSGSPIDATVVPQLIQPFKRIGPDHTTGRSTHPYSGVGLGLSIVDSIVAVHGGSLDLGARAGGGLEVDITLGSARVEPFALTSQK